MLLSMAAGAGLAPQVAAWVRRDNERQRVAALLADALRHPDRWPPLAALWLDGADGGPPLTLDALRGASLVTAESGAGVAAGPAWSKFIDELINEIARCADDDDDVVHRAKFDAIVGIVRRLVGTPAVRIRRRHHPGTVITVPPPLEWLKWSQRVRVRLDHLSVDGDVLSASDHALAPSGAIAQFYLGREMPPGEVDVRIEWSVVVSLPDPDQPRQHGSRTSERATVVAAFVHEQTIEIVPADADLVIPTTDPAHWPWGDGEHEWRLELRALPRAHDTVQLLALTVHIPDRLGVVVSGHWRVEQDGRTVDLHLGDAGSAKPARGDGTQSGVRWNLSVISAEPFDTNAPLTIRFVPEPQRMPRAVFSDHIWNAPLAIELVPESASRTARSTPTAVWTGTLPSAP